MTEAEALNTLLSIVEIFMWYPAPDSPDEPPSKITEIDLCECDISDEDLTYLAYFPYLEWLSLEDTTISDYGLTKLSDISSLKWLEVRGTNVTENGVSNLVAALPQCEVDW